MNNNNNRPNSKPAAPRRQQQQLVTRPALRQIVEAEAALVRAFRAQPPRQRQNAVRRPQAQRFSPYRKTDGGTQSFQARDQIGAVVRTQLRRAGMSDIRSHRMAWVTGYTYVGNGTNGAANAVLFLTGTGTYLLSANAPTANPNTSSSGMVPILGADTQLGRSYVSDIEKHYARKVIKRMWIHIVSLQPSTANNMMAILAPVRGGGGVEGAKFVVLATAGEAGNTVDNVSSMKGACSIDSFESKTIDITAFIAGGSGPRQNEFDLNQVVGVQNGPTIITAGAPSGVDGDGFVPACFTLAGNNTTAALQGTKVHEIIIEQEVDLLDYVGGMPLALPLA